MNVAFGVLAVLASILPFVVVVIAYPYLALRVRDSREEKRDPELGIKAAYYMMLSAAILMILFGLTMAAVDVMDGAFGKAAKANQRAAGGPFGPAPREADDFMNSAQRVAWALVVSGLLFSLTLMLLIKMGTNDLSFPAAKRVFLGGRLAFAGVIVMLAITGLIVLFFQKNLKETEPFEILTGILLVWLPTLAVHVFLMRYYSSQPYYVDRTQQSSTRRRRSEDLIDDDD